MYFHPGQTLQGERRCLDQGHQSFQAASTLPSIRVRHAKNQAIKSRLVGPLPLY
jgi:hypothetical protein